MSVVGVGALVAAATPASATPALTATDPPQQAVGTTAEFEPPSDEEILVESVARFSDQLSQRNGVATNGGLPGGTPDAVEYQVVAVPGDPDAKWVLPVGSELPAIGANGEWGVPGNGPLVDEAAGDTGDNTPNVGGVNNVDWQAPSCLSRYQYSGDSAGVWADVCTQWGLAEYSGLQLLRYPIYWMEVTCGKSASVPYTEIVKCGMNTHPTAGQGTVNWVDWAPKQNSSGACRSVSIGLTVFGAGASRQFDACESIKMTKGAVAPTFDTYWEASKDFFGNTVFIPDDEVRVAALQWGVAVPKLQASFWPTSYFYAFAVNRYCLVTTLC